MTLWQRDSAVIQLSEGKKREFEVNHVAAPLLGRPVVAPIPAPGHLSSPGRCKRGFCAKSRKLQAPPLRLGNMPPKFPGSVKGGTYPRGGRRTKCVGRPVHRAVMRRHYPPHRY